LASWLSKASVLKSKDSPPLSSSYQRYEILLPRKFNDGRLVPTDLISQTTLELRQQFRALSTETQRIVGIREHDHRVYQDDLMRIFLDVPDTLANPQFFVAFKRRLRRRFRQLDIWLTAHAIEVL
jgi:hypothetical protein